MPRKNNSQVLTLDMTTHATRLELFNEIKAAIGCEEID